jgi:D-alanyl-D-alanine carboxypeptidase
MIVPPVLDSLTRKGRYLVHIPRRRMEIYELAKSLSLSFDDLIRANPHFRSFKSINTGQMVLLPMHANAGDRQDIVPWDFNTRISLTDGFSSPLLDPDWMPPKPCFKPLVSNEDRFKVFGRFAFDPDPLPNEKEHVKIKGDWERKHIKPVFISQLKGIPVPGDKGSHPSSGKIQFYDAAQQQLLDMWADWETAGFLPLILTYDGSFNPRFVRGSTTHLSNHAFGTAFDINAHWNKRGHVPARLGQKGSVRELVEIANDHGFFWGGHYRPSDGMHFEVAELR